VFVAVSTFYTSSLVALDDSKQKIIDSIQKRYNISPSSPQVRSLKSQLEFPARKISDTQKLEILSKLLGSKELAAKALKEKSAEGKTDLPIRGHFRSNWGISFDETEHKEVSGVFSMQVTPERAHPKESERLGARVTNRTSLARHDSPIMHPTLLPCEKPKTIRRTHVASSNKGIFLNLLFLAGSPPENSGVYFGNSTLTHTYSESSNDPTSELGLRFGLRCLPSRILFRDGAAILYEGKDALKNFDLSPFGKFHPFIKYNSELFE